jgi:hypothetical protein
MRKCLRMGSSFSFLIFLLQIWMIQAIILSVPLFSYDYN